MDPVTTGTALIGTMVLLLLIGLPIGVALGASGIAGVILLRPYQAAEFLIGAYPYSFTANFSLTVLPLFLLMGYMAFAANLSRNAFEAAERWIGHIPGGLAMSTVCACAGFSAVCGSSVATASTIARVALPEMWRRGYSTALAGGCVAAGGTLGVLIPPSGILVIYSFVTEVSLVKLFLAALLPGALTAIVYMIGIYIWVKISPQSAGSEAPIRYNWSDRWTSLLRSWEVLLLFGVVMGSIYSGFATPTEAAAVGALLSVLMVLVRPQALKNLKIGLWDTGIATSSMFFLVIGAGFFSIALNLSQLPAMLSETIGSIDAPRYVIFALIVLIYLILGALVDGVSMILITMPIVYPIVLELGYDPVWFGIIIVKAVELGCITPPVGLNVFVLKSTVPDIKLGQVFKGAAPFVLMELIIVGLLMAFPQIALVLVN